MTILFQDGFAQYNSLASFNVAKGGEWHNANPSQVSYNTAALGGTEIRRTGVFHAETMYADLPEETQYAVISFILRTGSSTGQNFIRIGFLPKSWRTERQAPLIAYEFNALGSLAPEVVHSVPTSAAPAQTVNSLKVATGPEALAINQVYSVQMLVDIRNPTGIIKVFLNGVSYFDATFSRDRIANAWQPNTFGSLAFISGNHSYGCMISDLFVYTPDADHPFPLTKPHKIRYYAPSAVLATPADESTSVTVNTDQYANYPLPAGSVPDAAKILGGRAYVRMRAADGPSYANADIKLTIGGDDVQIVNDPIPAGFLSKLFTKALTKAQASPAAINAAIFKMRSPE